ICRQSSGAPTGSAFRRSRSSLTLMTKYPTFSSVYRAALQSAATVYRPDAFAQSPHIPDVRHAPSLCTNHNTASVGLVPCIVENGEADAAIARLRSFRLLSKSVV